MKKLSVESSIRSIDPGVSLAGPLSDAERVARLEASLAHLERNYDALNSVVVAQSRILTRLQKRLDKLDESLKTQDPERLSPHNAKPPHYAP